jgi:hypothetical protein
VDDVGLNYLAGLDDVDKEGGFFSGYGLAADFAEALHEGFLSSRPSRRKAWRMD